MSKRVICQVDRVLCVVETTMMVSLTLFGVGLGLAQVIMRYAFGSGFHWLETALVTALVWAMLFGASRAVREGFHPRVDLLPGLVSSRVRRWLNLIALCASGLLCLYFLYEGVFFASFLHRMDVINQETGLPQFALFLIIPVAMALFVVRYALLLFGLCGELDARDPEGRWREKFSRNVPKGDL
ncbi:hypothetical protein EHLJMEHL_00439 [Vreelandella titanicae]